MQTFTSKILKKYINNEEIPPKLPGLQIKIEKCVLP